VRMAKVDILGFPDNMHGCSRHRDLHFFCIRFEKCKIAGFATLVPGRVYRGIRSASCCPAT
jgi:hypothetical protein